MERKNPHPTNRDGLLYRSVSRSAATTSSEFVLQWGNRRRLRCMKVHGKDNKSASNDTAGSEQSQRAAVRVDRRVVRADLNNNNNNASKNPIPNPPTITNGYLNLRHRPASPSRRILSCFLSLLEKLRVKERKVWKMTIRRRRVKGGEREKGRGIRFLRNFCSWKKAAAFVEPLLLGFRSQKQVKDFAF